MGEGRIGTVASPVPHIENKSISSTELLTISEASDLLKISVASVRRLQQQRHIPFIKIGGSVRFTTKDLLSYIESRRVEAIE